MQRPERLIYLPCESYRERWTEIVSTFDGIFETGLKNKRINYTAIRPWTNTRTVETGVVLDTVARTHWGFRQTEELVRKIFKDEIGPHDVIYFEDFWHPGMEMVPYALSMKLEAKHWPRLAAFCHAQSVDPHDFTFPMAWWMRGFERSWFKLLDHVFVADDSLRDFLRMGGMPGASVCGTIFDSNIVRKIAGLKPGQKLPAHENRKRTAVFSSRWDREKDPLFFIRLAERVPDAEFVVCTGHPSLRSNEPELVREAMKARDRLHNFKIYTNLSKDEYYAILMMSRVQFNCADQDFVSYTLLESTTLGCHPLYPEYLSFPFALSNREPNLYTKGDLDSAAEKLADLLDDPDTDQRWVYRKYEDSQARLLTDLGFSFKGSSNVQKLA